MNVGPGIAKLWLGMAVCVPPSREPLSSMSCESELLRSVRTQLSNVCGHRGRAFETSRYIPKSNYTLAM